MSDFVTTLPPAPTAAADREALLKAPGFGKTFTDLMASMRWTPDGGWHDRQLMPRAPIAIDPAAAVLHYAQEVFEGLKAYRLADGGLALFRPRANGERLAASAARLAIPALPVDDFIASIEALVRAEADWVPPAEVGSLYLRPFIFADEPFLGVRPAQSYRYLVLASPAGGYFKGGADSITVRVAEGFTRAAPGGTGAAKCGGNYAASLVAQGQAVAAGCDQALFLDAAEGRYIEELSGMNLFFVHRDGRIVTPPLDGTILPGITRDAIITLAREAGHDVTEARVALDDVRALAASGDLTEMFACGTAAVVAPVREVHVGGGHFAIGVGNNAPVASALRAELTGIQRGTVPDRHGWVHRIA